MSGERLQPDHVPDGPLGDIEHAEDIFDREAELLERDRAAEEQHAADLLTHQQEISK